MPRAGIFCFHLAGSEKGQQHAIDEGTQITHTRNEKSQYHQHLSTSDDETLFLDHAIAYLQQELEIHSPSCC